MVGLLEQAARPQQLQNLGNLVEMPDVLERLLTVA